MSTKHFFGDPAGLVQRALTSLVRRHPHLELDEANRVVFSKTHVPAKVSIVSGGGSGHEPAWSGFVGDGMLSAAVAGDIFASPSTKQVMAGINSVPSDEGVILCITNYTGDRLHFGLAREKVHSTGRKIAQIALSDDVSLPRSKIENLGRRGLAGNILVLKLLGAAAQEGWNFEDCVRLGTETNANVASVGTSLDLCHVMGRTQQETVAPDACVLGMGVHNEPGFRTISPMPTPEDLVREMLKYVLDTTDSERNYVPFNAQDETCLLVNNLGGISTLELEGLTDVTLTQLAQEHNIHPSRIYVGSFETSLNAPGFSLSLCNLSAIARETSRPLSTIIDLLDAPTTAPAWPRNHYGVPVVECKASAARRHQTHINTLNGHSENDNTLKVSAPAALLPALKAACHAAIAAEPDITRYDTLMGDGDCGEGVRSACQALLTRFESAPFTQSPLPLSPALDAINATLEDVGGSLFAILSILVTTFAGILKRNPGDEVTVENVGKAAGDAVRGLFWYTGARVGDRTCMDALIPLCEALQGAPGDLESAVRAAERGAGETAGMRPRFGRATYVGDVGEMPPDPGAYAVAVWVRGFVQGWTLSQG